MRYGTALMFIDTFLKYRYFNWINPKVETTKSGFNPGIFQDGNASGGSASVTKQSFKKREDYTDWFYGHSKLVSNDMGYLFSWSDTLQIFCNMRDVQQNKWL